MQILMHALSRPPFGNYRVWWSLADSKYAGTALFVKKCFQPKKVSFSIDQKEVNCTFFKLQFAHALLEHVSRMTEWQNGKWVHVADSSSWIKGQSTNILLLFLASKHEPEGRVILAEFESFRLLNTYVPNNGWKDEETSFQRRRKWDKRMLEFVVQSSDKPLIWCGDLNVSHEEIDVSHPEFFSAAKHNGYVPPNKEDCGQPGFTLAERRRFGGILKEGKLVDAYRLLHKEKDMEGGFSWSGNPIGKYRGKRMRIDYFIVPEALKDRIVACEIHGQGIELKGFYGSDHCPVSLELSETSSSSNQS
ncbi:DNA-(apurinic or apyrimidinic site) lyase [Vitis vinifera]|uniref:DNA-(Apurinic or apyrimidinic site) lyase n=1 Tax=Vitis vinifera TaxID=29760 RepID=A0A438GSE6_VITVI|nr:DNA-(apurinic or apyrimidinic site) lyase [Vitis vinifera]